MTPSDHALVLDPLARAIRENVLICAERDRHILVAGFRPTLLDVSSLLAVQSYTALREIETECANESRRRFKGVTVIPRAVQAAKLRFVRYYFDLWRGARGDL
jgi:hypothetical protein